MVGKFGKALAGLGGWGAATPGVTDNRVVFGQTLGIDSVWGTAYRNYVEGLAAWLRHVNAAGGVHGRQIDVERLEDNYLTEHAVENVKRFGETNNVFGLVCIGGSAITQAVLPLLEQYHLPLVGTITGSELVRGYHRYLFHTRAGYATEVRKILQHLGSAGIRRVAVVYQDNAFGNGVFEVARKSAIEHGVDLVASVVHPMTDWDAEAIARQLAEAHAQAVLLFTAPQTVADIGKAYRAAQGHALPGPWVLSVTSATKLQELLGPDARRIAITQVMPHPGSTTSKLAHSYRAVAGEGGKQPNMSYEAMEGYLTGRVVTEALRRAGRQLTRETYIEALEGMGDLKVDDVGVKYTPQHHHGPSFVEVAIVGRQAAAA